MLNTHDLEWRVRDIDSDVNGEMHVNYKITEKNMDSISLPFDCKIINLIFDDPIIKIDYVDNNNDAMHLGTIYGRLSSTGTEIQGEFIGYGLISEQFVSGEVLLTKQLR